MHTINQVCVIGAGVMGSGIAAQIANSGTKVLLLDIASKNPDRSSIANDAILRMHNTKPSPFSHPSRAEFITTGNLDDDLDKLQNCQLVIEAIVEKLDIKQALYLKILPFLKKDTIIASNTSTIPLSHLKKNIASRSDIYFMILHFFNPPRYMRLLELISDHDTPNNIIDIIVSFLAHKLGKSVVKCNDTPGFIANRVGCFLLEIALRKAIEHKINIEAIDHVFTKCLFLPSTGIFGLYDLIGIDVMGLIANSLIKSMDEKDRFVEIYKPLPMIDSMISKNYIGRKGLGGFYRMNNIDGKKIKEVINLDSLEYNITGQNLQSFKTIEEVLNSNTPLAKAMDEILTEFIEYTCSLIPIVTPDIYDLDLAMRLGYSWKYGPFELFDKIVPIKPSSFLKIAATIDRKKFVTGAHILTSMSLDTVIKNNSSILRKNDKGLYFSITTKMNSLNQDIFNLIISSVDEAEKLKLPLYIYSDTAHFSAGADLRFFLEKINTQDWKAIENLLLLGQKAMQKIKYAKVPVIAVAQGVALGGGCEILLHSHHIVANQQLSAGLVEVGIGLVPGWGGIKEMVLRSQGNKEILIRNLRNILLQNKSSSADYFASDYGVNLTVNMNPDYLIEEAHNIKLKTNDEHITSVSIPQFKIEDIADIKSLDPHTQNILLTFATLSDQKITEDELLDYERNLFMQLLSSKEVKAKIEDILSSK